VQLQAEIEQGSRPMTNTDFRQVIRKFLVTLFGNYKLISIDAEIVREFDIGRNQQIGHMPNASACWQQRSSAKTWQHISNEPGATCGTPTQPWNSCQARKSIRWRGSI